MTIIALPVLIPLSPVKFGAMLLSVGDMHQKDPLRFACPFDAILGMVL